MEESEQNLPQKHSPLEGVIDIKPTTNSPLVGKDIIFISLTAILIFIAALILFRKPFKLLLRSRIFNSNKKSLTAFRIAQKDLDELKRHILSHKDKDELYIKNFSEKLITIQKKYLNSLVPIQVTASTSYELSLSLKKLLSQKLTHTSETKINDLLNKIESIFILLEEIEYQPISNILDNFDENNLIEKATGVLIDLDKENRFNIEHNNKSKIKNRNIQNANEFSVF